MFSLFGKSQKCYYRFFFILLLEQVCMQKWDLLISHLTPLLQNFTGVRVQRNKLVGIFNSDGSPAGVPPLIRLHPLQRRSQRKRFSAELKKINTGFRDFEAFESIQSQCRSLVTEVQKNTILSNKLNYTKYTFLP